MARILIIENQYRQYLDIRKKLTVANHTCFPEVDDYITFTDWVRIFLEERYANAKDPLARRRKVWDFIMAYISSNEIELLMVDHKLSGSHYGKDGIYLAKELRDKKIDLPILFLSRTEANNRDVMEKLKTIDNHRWVEKGYAGQRIFDQGYFENQVLEIIPTMLSNDFEDYKTQIISLKEHSPFLNDEFWNDILERFNLILSEEKLESHQKKALDEFALSEKLHKDRTLFKTNFLK